MMIATTVLLLSLGQLENGGALRQDSGSLVGKVLDLHGAVIPGVYVTVTSGDETCKTRSNERGGFECSVTAGQARVTASAMGFLPYRRASVTVIPHGRSFVTIRPALAAPTAEHPKNDPKLQYSTWRLSTGLEVEIQYETSSTSIGEVAYRGSDVMLTADTLSVRAREIRCSSASACSAHGTVVIDMGIDTIEGTEASFDLIGRRLTLTREPVVTREF